jgi:nanoRNase/pAp phosphatase (c-di-AMP/oligoRNAs hydrolase)
MLLELSFDLQLLGSQRYVSCKLGNLTTKQLEVLKEAFAGMGEAGGHATMAAAVIPLNYFSMVKDKEELLDLIIEPILKRIRRIVGLEDEAKHEV